MTSRRDLFKMAAASVFTPGAMVLATARPQPERYVNWAGLPQVGKDGMSDDIRAEATKLGYPPNRNWVMGKAYVNGVDVSMHCVGVNESRGWVIVLSRVPARTGCRWDYRSPCYPDSHPASVAAGRREGRELYVKGGGVYEVLRGKVKIVVEEYRA